MSAIGDRETCKQTVLQHERCHNRGINVWWATGRERLILQGVSVTEGQTSRGQEDIPGRENSMCAGMKAYKEEKCGMPKCPNIADCDCQRAQGWCFHPASCSGLSSCSSSSSKHCARCWSRMWNRSRSLGKGEGLCDQLQTQRSLWLVLFWRRRDGFWEALPKEDYGRTWGLADLAHPWT